MINKFSWSGFYILNSNSKLFCANYRHVFGRLAESLILKKEFDSARTVLNNCLMIMPNNVVYYDIMMLKIAECYYSISEFEKANEISKTISYNVKQNKISLQNEEQKKAIIKYLRELAEKYNQKQILKNL